MLRANIVIIVLTLVYCRVVNKLRWGDMHVLWATEETSNSGAWFDGCIIGHIAGGMFYKLILSARVSRGQDITRLVILACLFEMFENTPAFIKLWNDPTYHGDSIINVFTDICAAVVGYVIAERLDYPVALAIAVAIALYCLRFSIFAHAKKIV